MSRIVGEMRVGGVPLHSVRRQMPGQTAAPADLDHVAENARARRLTDEAGVEGLAALRQPLEHLPGAVDRGALLVAGDQEADRTGKRGALLVEVISHRRDKGGDRPLHVDGTAAAQRAVAERGTERIERPGRARPGGHDVGMTGKAEIGPAGPVAGIEVVDLVAAGAAAKDEAVASEANAFQSLGDDGERALVPRRDARPADQPGGERRRSHIRFVHSRSRSLIEVLARVCSSTFLTMTAQ